MTEQRRYPDHDRVYDRVTGEEYVTLYDSAYGHEAWIEAHETDAVDVEEQR